MKKKTPETLSTNALIQYLTLMGYTVKKIYNGGVPARADGTKIIYRKKSEDYKGIPDLLAYNVKRGKFLFIEAKSPLGRVKPKQREFIEAFNSCNSYSAIVARDIDDLRGII